jgi:hypothetical protein
MGLPDEKIASCMPDEIFLPQKKSYIPRKLSHFAEAFIDRSVASRIEHYPA